MRIAICEDNELDRTRCAQLVQDILDKQHMEAELELYETGDEFLFYMEEAKRPLDIILLDMHMPGTQGVEVAFRLRELGIKSEIIFCTVSIDHYTAAFDVKAFHYVVKGQTPMDKFEKIFLSVLEEIQRKNKEYIMCSGAGEYRNIEIHSIRYFQVDKRIITVHYNEKEQFSFYSTIGKIENRLRNYGFIRIHRSFLASQFWIRSINYQAVVLQSGEELPVGRSYYSELKEAMANYVAQKE